MRSVDLVGIQVELSSGAPVVILREHDAPHRVLPIFVGGAEAASIAVAATGATPPRPLTHDLTATILRTLGGELESIEVTGLADGTYLASLTLSGPTGRHRIDTRPSDAIAVAIRLGAPLFVSDDVLAAAGAIPVEAADEPHAPDTTATGEVVDIDAEVDRFRELLGGLDSASIWSGLTTGTATAPSSDDAPRDASPTTETVAHDSPTPVRDTADDIGEDDRPAGTVADDDEGEGDV